MEPSQIKHLREAAADIRNQLITMSYQLDEIHGTLEADPADIMDSALRKVANIERALTRIDMCLKEVGK